MIRREKVKSQITVSSHYYSGTKTVTNENQKFPCGQRVYIRPIHEECMLHFDCDLITNVKYTYEQAFGNCGPCSQYSTDIASWYDECQLMPVDDDCSIDEARGMCVDYFGESHKILEDKRKESIDKHPLIQGMRDSFLKSFSSEFGGLF